jgi:hypothetical protein
VSVLKEATPTGPTGEMRRFQGAIYRHYRLQDEQGSPVQEVGRTDQQFKETDVCTFHTSLTHLIYKTYKLECIATCCLDLNMTTVKGKLCCFTAPNPRALECYIFATLVYGFMGWALELWLPALHQPAACDTHMMAASLWHTTGP